MGKTAVSVMSVLFTFGLFCAAPQSTVQKNSEKSHDALPDEIVEDFDPTSLDAYDFEIPTTNHSKLKPINIEHFLKGENQPDSSSTLDKIAGFRVQLASTRIEEEARAIKRGALLDFDDIVYLTFDDPYYKVRLGDFISRYEANDLQELSVEKGYLEAWVVRTFVSLKKTSVNEDQR